MRVVAIVEHLCDIRDYVGGDWPAIAIFRELDIDLDDDGAWEELPIVSVEVDGDEVDIESDPSGESVALNVAELLNRLEALAQDESEVFVTRGWVFLGGEEDERVRIDTPVVASMGNPERRLFGLAAAFEGWEQVLRDPA